MVPAAPEGGETLTVHDGAVAPPPPEFEDTQVRVVPETERLEQLLRLMDWALAEFVPKSTGPATAASATIRRGGVRIGVS